MTLRKLFKEMIIRSSVIFNSLLDFNLKKVFSKRFFILISLSLFTPFFVFYSFMMSAVLLKYYSISYFFLLIPLFILSILTRFLLKKIKSNFLAFKYEFKTRK
jgi:hypothetical protein